MRESNLLLLSGERGVGKSTVCLRLAEQLRVEGYPVGGVITLCAENRRYALDIVGGDQRLLAAEDRDLSGPSWGKFSFSQDTLDWAHAVVREAISHRAALVILDEVGPLEIVLRQGFLPAFQALIAAPVTGLVVVRPTLLRRLRRRVQKERPVTQRTVTLANREYMPGRVIKWLRQQGLEEIPAY
jgi:nucleoside-triphosphatase THEP1